MNRTSFKNEVSISELEYLRSQGLTNKEIAERMGVSVRTIYRYLPPQRKRVKLTEEDYAGIAKLYRDGRKEKDIANVYNCSCSTVTRILQRYGLIVKGRRCRIVKCGIGDGCQDGRPAEKTADQFSSVGSIAIRTHTIGKYKGWLGNYVIDYTDKMVELPLAVSIKWTKLTKDQLSQYIRDLMAIHKELQQLD